MIRVAALWRHPIKGHGREPLDHVTLTEGQTMPWDRRWAVAHEAAKADGSEWAPSLNFSRGSKCPRLMAINARVDEATGKIILTHPDRPELCFDPARDADAFLEWVEPIMPTDRAASAKFYRIPDRGMTDTNYPSVSLINLASNAAVAEKVGQPISQLRWRANIHLEGLDAWAEFGWIGKTLRIGTAEVSVVDPILRCPATSANPETGIRDVDTLGTLKSNWGHQNFGVYAKVTQSGDISTGDSAEVL